MNERMKKLLEEIVGEWASGIRSSPRGFMCALDYFPERYESENDDTIRKLSMYSFEVVAQMLSDESVRKAVEEYVRSIPTNNAEQ